MPSLLSDHRNFTQILHGALIDAPLHLRLRKFVSGFHTNYRAITADQIGLQSLSELRRTLCLNPDAFAVKLLEYRCRSRWDNCIQGINVINMQVLVFLDNTKESRFTRSLRKDALRTQNLHQDMRQHQQEYTAVLARRIQLTDTAAIYVVLHQTINDIKYCHPIKQLIARRVMVNSRARRFAPSALKELRRTLDVYDKGLVSLRNELSNSWMPALLRFLEKEPAHELRRKRAMVSRYWLRRIQHQKVYEAAMKPIQADLEYSRMMKGRIRRKWANGEKRGRQSYQDVKLWRTSGTLPGGGNAVIANHPQVVHGVPPARPYKKVQFAQSVGHRRHSRSYSVAINSRRERDITTFQNSIQGHLRIEYLDARKRKWSRERELQRDRGPWENFVQLMEEHEEQMNYLNPAKRILHQYEYELANVTGPSQRIAVWRVQSAQKELHILQHTWRLNVHGHCLYLISDMLRAAPFPCLRRMHWLFKECVEPFRKDLKTYKALLGSRIESRHLIGRSRRLSIRPSCIEGAEMNTDRLWYMINQQLDWPSRSYSAATISALKSFLVALRTFRESCRVAQNTLFVTNLRRTPKSQMEFVFDAMNHRVTNIQASKKYLTSFVHRTVKKSTSAHSPFSRHLYRRQNAIHEQIYGLLSCWDEILYIYNQQYLPVYIRRLELMAPDELQRRSDQAKSYWVGYWQMRSEDEKREKEIEQFRQDARKQKNLVRSKMRGLAKKIKLGIRVNPANEQQDQDTRPKHSGYKKYRKQKKRKDWESHEEIS